MKCSPRSEQTTARPRRNVKATAGLFVAGPIVLGQQVLAEVAVEVPPNRVNMIGVILRFVELNQKRGRLNAVIMLVGGSRPAGPGKPDVIPRFLNLVFLQYWITPPVSSGKVPPEQP